MTTNLRSRPPVRMSRGWLVAIWVAAVVALGGVHPGSHHDPAGQHDPSAAAQITLTSSAGR